MKIKYINNIIDFKKEISYNLSVRSEYYIYLLHFRVPKVQILKLIIARRIGYLDLLNNM